MTEHPLTVANVMITPAQAMQRSTANPYELIINEYDGCMYLNGARFVSNYTTVDMRNHASALLAPNVYYIVSANTTITLEPLEGLINEFAIEAAGPVTFTNTILWQGNMAPDFSQGVVQFSIVYNSISQQYLGSWALYNQQQAAQGLQGLQGLQGVQGIQGNTGTNGNDGSQGLQGLQGLQGIQGAKGTNGTNGTNGSQGLQGLQGIQGVKGTGSEMNFHSDSASISYSWSPSGSGRNYKMVDVSSSGNFALDIAWNSNMGENYDSYLLITNSSSSDIVVSLNNVTWGGSMVSNIITSTDFPITIQVGESIELGLFINNLYAILTVSGSLK